MGTITVPERKPVMKRTFVIALSLSMWMACDPDPTGPGPSPYPRDDELRLNHVQAKGTHNSYHVEPENPVDDSHRYCRKHASKLEGLYVVDAAGKFTQVTPKHDAWDLKWSGNRYALVQFGGQVGFVDVGTPRFGLLGPPAAHLRAFGPRALKKCAD